MSGNDVYDTERINLQIKSDLRNFYRRHGMRAAILTRQPSTDICTQGTLVLDDGTTYATMEKPWLDNANDVSCIPVGIYTCKWINSPRHGWCYQVMNVPNRFMIEIHSANWAWQLLGCIALGKSAGMLSGLPAVLTSKDAIADFDANLAQDDLQLTIQ